MSIELIEFLSLVREHSVSIDLKRVQRFTSIFSCLEVIQDCCKALGEPAISLFNSSDLASLANLMLNVNKIPPVVDILEGLAYLLYSGIPTEDKSLEYWYEASLFPRQKGVH